MKSEKKKEKGKRKKEKTRFLCKSLEGLWDFPLFTFHSSLFTLPFCYLPRTFLTVPSAMRTMFSPFCVWPIRCPSAE